MNKRSTILFIGLLTSVAFVRTSYGHGTVVPWAAADTVITDSQKTEDKVIDEVIKSPKPLEKDKIQYVSQVTKYGFRDLFKNYSYNPAMPYSSQVNPYAETYMQDYLQVHGKSLQQMKATAVPYFNLIDGILVKYGLPKELKYLAVIESDLKSNALSYMGARGPWQFMVYTAKDFGLQVDQEVDDRTDYFKSTNAAAKYLLSLYKNFNDWLLVIAAYNGGPQRVNAAIKKCGSRDFWKLQYYLPEESRNHVKKFIATHYIMETAATGETFNYQSQDGKTDSARSELSKEELVCSDSLVVSGRYSASIVASNIDMNAGEFNRYNPGFDEQMAVGKSFTMKLPGDKMTLFKDKKFIILNACVEQLINDTKLDAHPPSQKNALR